MHFCSILAVHIALQFRCIYLQDFHTTLLKIHCIAHFPWSKPLSAQRDLPNTSSYTAGLGQGSL